MDRSSGSVTRPERFRVSRASPTSPNDSANRLALSTLMASRRPTFIWAVSRAASMPSRAEAAQ
jgi:hypothetical protein